MDDGGGSGEGRRHVKTNPSSFLPSFLPSLPLSSLYPVPVQRDGAVQVPRTRLVFAVQRDEDAFHLPLAVLSPPLLLSVNLLSINLFSDKETDRKRNDRWRREPAPFTSLISNYSTYTVCSKSEGEQIFRAQEGTDYITNTSQFPSLGLLGPPGVCSGSIMIN